LAWSCAVFADEAEDKKGPLENLKFRNVGPAAGGRVSRSAGVPGDPRVYYAATASGGVWKSTDGGIHWKSIFDDQPTSSIGAIAVAPSDANVVYVGSGEANIRGNVQPGNGIYKSGDGGKTWKHVWKQKGQIGQMIVHPTNPDIAYAAVLGSAFGPNPERGVYRTIDGGKHWQHVLKKDADSGAIDLCFDPNNPRILYAALWQARRTPWNLISGGPGSGLYKSVDAGDTWKQLKPGEAGLPDGPWGRIGLAVAPSDSRRVYALIEADKGGLFRSDDAGDAWELVSGARYLRQRPWYFSTVHVDPQNKDVVWCPNVRLLKSIDGGRTFKNVKGPHHVDHHDLWIDPKDPKRMIDSNDGGVDITLNGGETWYAPLLPISQFYHISVDNRVPYHVMGNMQDLGTASGPSNSLSSEGIAIGHWHTVGGGETGFSMPDPKDPNVVFSGEYSGYISRYDHRTRQARNMSIYPINPSGHGAEQIRYRFQWTAPILISPHDNRVVYHAANVLFRTSDGGLTWQKTSPDLTRDDKGKQKWSGGPITGDNTGAEYYCTIFAIAESPLKKGVLWAGSDDGLVHVTQDDGKSWVNVTKNIPGFPEWATVTGIETSRRGEGTAYIVAHAYRLDDDRPYLFKTSDFGKTWKSLSAKLPAEDHLHVVREDPLVPRMLYVGTETGIHFSRDDGETWERLKLNLPTVAVTDMTVKDNDLVVGTNGRSIWILDDLTPIRQWSKKLAEAPHLFSAQPAIRWRYHGPVYGTDDRYAGDNPLKGAIIHYHLPKKAKGEITLEILDDRGELVRTLSSLKKEEKKEDDPDPVWAASKEEPLTNKPGVNRVAWDLHYQGATIIPGAKNDGGNPKQGPLALPGKYILKLNVESKSFTTTLEVKPDPRVQVPPSILKEQHRFALTVRDDISRLSQNVLSLRSIRTQLAQRNELLKDGAKADSLVKQAKELINKLDALEEKFHNPKAQVTYDILAMKGGAKLYSQITALYDWARDSDGAVTQGMREVYERQKKELGLLESELDGLLRGDLSRLNDLARSLEIPNVIWPLPMDAGKKNNHKAD